MTTKYPKSKAQSEAELQNEPMFVSWNGMSAEQINNIHTGALSYYGGYRSQASNSRDFSNLQTNVSGRPGMTRDYYDFFRPEEATPKKLKAILNKANEIYKKVGLVRHIIDLMGDFACQGIRLSHPNKRIEKFYNHWFARINGKERSERFLNHLYRFGNVITRMQTAKIRERDKQDIFKSVAANSVDIDSITKLNILKGVIPWKINFVNPISVHVVGEELSSLIGEQLFAITLPHKLRNIINSPKDNLEKQIVAKLPQEIRDAAKTNSPVLLPPDKTKAYHYKKDDWQVLALPMIYAIMDDIMIIEKMKLADVAALDGAISNIRIFKLGSLEHQIMPTRAAAAKLAEILESNVGGGTMELVWGPDIELLESKTNVHQFLTPTKYEVHFQNVYSGLGIPPTLTGTFGASGTTNNFISLKTLTQRLEYGRDTLIKFWTELCIMVQKAMGFRFPATVEFDLINLGDEVAEKTLLVQLADRNLISDELLQRAFKHDPELEKIRLNRESRERDSGRMVPKSSPYHEPEFEKALKKVFAQSGVVTPSQLGIELEPNKDGQKPALDMRQPIGGGGNSPSKKGQPQQGRPRNSTDTQQRKTKTFKPKTRAVLQVWANQAQLIISKVVTPIVLKYFNKSNLRQLSNEETNILENIKFGVLSNLEPLTAISEKDISKAMKCKINSKMLSAYHELCMAALHDMGSISIDNKRDIQSIVYAMFNGENDVNN